MIDTTAHRFTTPPNKPVDWKFGSYLLDHTDKAPTFVKPHLQTRDRY